jgi:hypothetical protein
MYVWKFKSLMLRLLPISHNQDQPVMYVFSHKFILSCDRQHTVSVPTISTMDAVSIPHQYIPFLSKQLNYHTGVSEILGQVVGSI